MRANFLAGSIGIIIGCVFKSTSLGPVILSFFGFEPSELNLYIAAGFSALVTKLSIKGVVEEFFSDLGIYHYNLKPDFIYMGGLPLASNYKLVLPSAVELGLDAYASSLSDEGQVGGANPSQSAGGNNIDPQPWT
jgi:hypothetical protein